MTKSAKRKAHDQKKNGLKPNNKEPKVIPPSPGFQIQAVTGGEMAFGIERTKVSSFVPDYENIPKEFKSDTNPWHKIIDRWFFDGLRDFSLKTKENVDENQALSHLNGIMRSWNLPHEHKISGCAYLMSLWFEPNW